MRVEDPMLSIVAMRLRLVSLSGAMVYIAFQRPLNSSISAMSFRISGVMVMFFISCMIGYPFLPIFTRFLRAGKQISIYIHFHPFLTQREAFGWKKGRQNCHTHPVSAV